jgi:hypothetical protein
VNTCYAGPGSIWSLPDTRFCRLPQVSRFLKGQFHKIPLTDSNQCRPVNTCWPCEYLVFARFSPWSTTFSCKQILKGIVSRNFHCRILASADYRTYVSPGSLWSLPDPRLCRLSKVKKVIRDSFTRFLPSGSDQCRPISICWLWKSLVSVKYPPLPTTSGKPVFKDTALARFLVQPLNYC